MAPPGGRGSVADLTDHHLGKELLPVKHHRSRCLRGGPLDTSSQNLRPLLARLPSLDDPGVKVNDPVLDTLPLMTGPQSPG